MSEEVCLPGYHHLTGNYATASHEWTDKEKQGKERPSVCERPGVGVPSRIQMTLFCLYPLRSLTSFCPFLGEGP